MSLTDRLPFYAVVVCCVAFLGVPSLWWYWAVYKIASPPAAFPMMVERLCIMDRTATGVHDTYVVPSMQVAGWCHATGETVSSIVGITEGGVWRLGVLQDDAITEGEPARIKVQAKE